MTDNDSHKAGFIEGPANGVQQTHQLYVPTDVAQATWWPFETGDTYRGLVHPAGCVLLWPQGSPPDLPLSITPPPPESVPWPASTMGQSPPDWVRLNADTAAAVQNARRQPPPTQAASNSSSSESGTMPDRPDAHPGRNNTQ